MPLTRAQILASKPVVEELDVPEWGGPVFVRGINSRWAVKLANTGTANTEAGDIPMLVEGVVNEDGSPVFTTEDIQALLDLPFAGTVRALAAIKRLSGLTPEAPKAPAASS